MIERDSLKRRAKSLSTLASVSTAEKTEAWNRFKKIRNEINNRKKREEILYKSEKLKESFDSTDILWRTAKSFMGWKTAGIPVQLSVDGQLLTSAKQIAQVMNNYFIEKVYHIRRQMKTAPADNSKIETIMQNKTCRLQFHHISVSKVQKLLRGLSSSKSTGMDGLDNFSVKLSAAHIAKPLQYIIELSRWQQKFSSAWKKSKIIPLHKKNDPLDKQNYRPVSLLSPLSKVLEKTVYEELYCYFSNNRIFHPSLHGYRKGRSTQTALLQLYDKFVRAAGNGKLSGAVLLDLSSAFDLVDPEILIQKLKLYNVDDTVLNWFQSYLMERQQAVWIDHAYSDLQYCNVGVPQGSNLGPLLFLAFYNDLPFNLTCDVEAYADDTTLYSSGVTFTELETKLTNNCAKVSLWMAQNKLKLNASKTHVMAIGTSRRLQQQEGEIKVTMDGLDLIESETKAEVLLGCSVQSNLKWNSQVEAVQQKLKTRIGALEHLRYVLPYTFCKLIVNAYLQ